VKWGPHSRDNENLPQIPASRIATVISIGWREGVTRLSRSFTVRNLTGQQASEYAADNQETSRVRRILVPPTL
jgi:hypothetical protein